MENILLNGGDDGGDDIFVYMGGEQEVPRDVKRAKIDGSIDIIPRRAFHRCKQLIKVEGHNKLKKIEEDAFYACFSLRWLTKMTGVKEIEAGAFNFCKALGDVEFDKLDIIGPAAFEYCKSLRSINLPSIKRIGKAAFYNCTSLTEAELGKHLEKIGVSAFQSCPALRRIAVPLKDDSIIENGAFFCCDNLTRVDIVGRIHKTISSFHLKSWRGEMREEIDRINQTLPKIPASEKTNPIQQWIRSVVDRMEHYKAEHQILLKEAMALLELALWKAKLDENGSNIDAETVCRKECRVTCGASIVIKNVLPFLVLM